VSSSDVDEEVTTGAQSKGTDPPTCRLLYQILGRMSRGVLGCSGMWGGVVGCGMVWRDKVWWGVAGCGVVKDIHR
jgi:hypothetical protein